MTLLAICQAAADRIGLELTPATIVGNNEPDARRLLTFANAVGADLSTRGMWQAQRFYVSFAASGNIEQVNATPPDFRRFCDNTMWNRSREQFINGPVDPAEWATRTAIMKSSVPSEGEGWFARRGNVLLTWPAPNIGDEISYEYQSRAYCRSASGTLQTAWLADTDVPVLDAELMIAGIIARFLMADGQPTASMAMMDFERRRREEMASERDPTPLSVGDIWNGGRAFSGSPGDVPISPWIYSSGTWGTNPTYWGQ